MLDVKKLLAKIVRQFTYIGRVYSASSNVTITNTSIDTYTNGSYVTLPAGTYVIVGTWTFNTRTTTGTTNSQICFRNGASGGVYGAQRIFAAGANYNILCSSTIQTFLSETDVYVAGSTSRVCSSMSNDTNLIRAVRIA